MYFGLPGERWLPVPESGRKYFVSDHGRVASFGRLSPTGGILKGEVDKDGYTRVCLSLNDRKQKWVVSRLVLTVFVGPPDNVLMEAAHNDGDPSNNSLGNLRWATRKENVDDKITHGTQQIGSKNPAAMQAEDRIRVVKRCLELGITLKNTAYIAGVTKHIAADVSRGRTWAHI